jgi:hypothetical protein
LCLGPCPCLDVDGRILAADLLACLGLKDLCRGLRLLPCLDLGGIGGLHFGPGLLPAGRAARVELGPGPGGGLGLGRGCLCPFPAGGVGDLEPFPGGAHDLGQCRGRPGQFLVPGLAGCLGLVQGTLPRAVAQVDLRADVRGCDGLGAGVLADLGLQLARAIITIAEAGSPPLRALLGTDTLHAIKAELDQQRAEIDEWEKLSRSTDFPQ